MVLEARDTLERAADLIFKLSAQAEVPKNLPHNNRPKLTKRDVLLIRQMKRNGETQAAIAEVFDVNAGTISRIIRGYYHK
jgi:DNA-binding NarL/FixJ family response regulator